MELNKKAPFFKEAFCLSAPEGSRTPNLQIRSLPLYPIELRAHKGKYI